MAIPVPDFSRPATWRVHVAHTPPGQPPAAPRLPLAFEPFLFLTPAHQALQPHGLATLACFLEDVGAGYTVAQLYVVLDAAGPGLARSPGQASFGGVQLAPGLPASALLPLLEAAEAALRQHQQIQLELRGYASCYDPAGAAALAEALGAHGYRVALSEDSYYLATAHDYETHLHRSERRRLQRCRRAGLVVEQEPPYLVPAAYEFIAACRQERGQSLSLPRARIEALFRAFPRQHFLFSVRKPGSGDWAALSVAIQVNSRVVYNLYHASPLSENDLSPVVLLNEGLHAYARSSGAAAVDLGTSMLASGPNEPLLRFKRNLGGVADQRLTWQKTL
ncbi:hypothetical protein [Hymenobacter bucti]|uniref:GNAT family N-acetyltransferase n=1 Tax=Hymenobacter bucti TaxID=1844114 RepID=A0ABW4QSR0_9BACT